MLLLGVIQAQAAGQAAGSFDLLETQVLSSSAASVTFAGLSTYAADYQHLQIRYALRTTRSNNLDGVTMTVNGDTAGNYSYHRLFGDGSSVTSDAATSSSFMYLSLTSDASSTAGAFGVGVTDILDPFETTKYTTFRTLGGVSIPTNPYVSLMSGSWRNTNALTSITFDQTTGPSFAIGSRFSLYGIRGV